MYCNEATLHYIGDKIMDDKNTIMPFDDSLAGSMLPKFCEAIDVDECGLPSSSTSHEDDPTARLPCFPSLSYPYNQHVWPDFDLGRGRARNLQRLLLADTPELAASTHGGLEQDRLEEPGTAIYVYGFINTRIY
ncbi:hypothetical protein HHK36_014321 [Tetracentron sinense]|uniref:Uncharacterized protein n=1 Tax=Tetracentron sinense TaxID=13715 RepID=A0A834Z9J2_TETSI|nr:hypothetical protein HHK36_014321 [Tetracentron sinense]